MDRLTVIPSPKRTGSGDARVGGDATVARDLASAIEGEVRFDLHNRMLYATDASLYQVAPLGVVIPANVDDALRAVEFCAERSLPILPRGGGTSLAGQCTNRAVVIDFSANCRGVESVDAGGRRARVEPGITVDDLNDRLSKQGLFFAPDPATSRQANIGGCIGNNAAGARSVMFGRTSENLLGVDAAVLSEGGVRRVRLERGGGAGDPVVAELTRCVAGVVAAHAGLIRERFPKTIRRNAGYSLDLILQQMDSAGARADGDAVLGAINLAHLVCGSEGTLAVTLGAELLLRPTPRAKGLALIGFASLDEAIDLVAPILGTRPSAVELLDDTLIDLASANTEYSRYVGLMPSPREGALRAVLYVEYFASESAAELPPAFEALERIVASGAPTAAVVTHTDAKSMLQAWKLRKAGEPLLHGMPGDRKPITFVEDNAVPVERLGEFVREFRAIVARYGTRAAFWAHASVGVLHVRPFLDIRDEADRERMQGIAVEIADLAQRMGGVMSGEHGDGKVRGPLLERFYGPELMRAFREIKAIFDPRNLLNPGNIVEPGPVASITERLRIQPERTPADVPAVETYFDYEDQHGFRGAVEMCNGAGVCRKKTSGTMCPSYMGTLDERHSTRGRGNALRLAITGQLAMSDVGCRMSDVEDGAGLGSPSDIRHPTPDIWNDAGTIGTLDLCLSCKACKSECPSNVDIARLKAEYTAQRYRSTGRVPLKARAFGHVRWLNRFGSMTPGLANWTSRLPVVRGLVNRMLGLAPQRSIPEFATSLKKQWGRSADSNRGPGRRGSLGQAGGRVALFGDCFTMYNDPHIGLAAKRVLGAFGYGVELADAGCCSRSLMSTGMLEEAIATADRTLARLRPLIEDDGVRAILVAEPSCLSAFKDDWLQLKLTTPIELRRRLAAKSFLIDDFLDREWDRHPARPQLSGNGSPVILHAHCHQKALWGAETSASLLRRVLGEANVRVLDSGCCGMAGSFGYTADHYELSMKIGGLTLFPAVWEANAETAVVAPGTSCRHQIHDGTGRRAVHPLELIASLLP